MHKERVQNMIEVHMYTYIQVEAFKRFIKESFHVDETIRMNRIEKEEKKTCDDKKKIHAMKLS